MNERWKWTLRCSFQCRTERTMCQGKVYTQFSFLYFDRSVRKGSLYSSSNDFPLSKDQPTWLWPLCSVDSMKNMSVRSLQQLRVQKWAPVATSFSSICCKMRDRLSQGGQNLNENGAEFREHLRKLSIQLIFSPRPPKIWSKAFKAQL